MDILEVTAVILTIIVNIYFAFLVFSRDKTSETNIYFSLMFLSIDAWALSNYMYNRPGISYDEIVFWMRIVFVATTPLITLIFLFAFSYPNRKSTLSNLKKILFLIPTTILFFASFTGFIVDGATINNRVALPKFGIGIWPYFLYVLIYVSITLYVLLKKYLKTKGIQKSQLLYLFIGFVLFLLPATLTNLILVVIFNNVALAAFGPIFSLFLGFFLSYAILRHRLFDISYLSSIFVQYTVLAAITYGIFYLTLYVDITIFRSPFVTGALIFNTVIAFVYCIFIFQFHLALGRFVSKSIEKISNLEIVKEEFKNEVVVISNLKPLINETLALLKVSLDLKDITCLIMFEIAGKLKSQIFSTDNRNKEFYIGLQSSNDNYLRFKSVRDSILRQEWTANIRTQELNSLVNKIFENTSTELIIPVITNNKTIALFNFGEKKSEWNYSIQDLKFLFEIIQLISIPLERAQLLEDVKNFSDVLQERINEATAELQSQKTQLEEKYQFEKDMMGIMGHELRTPMTVAKGMAELVLEKAKKPENDIDREYLMEKMNTIFKSIVKESDLIQTMLSTSHIDNNKINLQLGKVDIKEIIDFNIGPLQKEADTKKLDLQLDLNNEEIPLIINDQNRVQEIVTNLISNAIKYTNEGFVKVHLEKQGDFILFSVQDSGLGIPKNELNNIGKKFYRIHQHLDEKKDIVRAGGTGLGLYVVKGLLKAMGGELIVESEENKGSKFTALFPLEVKENENVIISDVQADSNDMFAKMGFER